MEKVVKSAGLYIATLKAIVLITQNAHWVSKGDNSYGDHLLFERLYEKATKSLDAAAEKIIGVFGEGCLSFELQNKYLFGVLLTYKDFEGQPAHMCLAIEKGFLKLSQRLYELYEEEGVMTLGLDDFLMSNASDHEEAVYLLQQNLK